MSTAVVSEHSSTATTPVNRVMRVVIEIPRLALILQFPLASGPHELRNSVRGWVPASDDVSAPRTAGRPGWPPTGVTEAPVASVPAMNDQEAGDHPRHFAPFKRAKSG